jgi:hypothetical protein
MFDDSDIKQVRRGVGFWLKIAAAVLFLLLAYNFYRVNRTEPPPASPTPVPVQYTEGEIVNERVSIEPGGFMSYSVNLNHRSTINGNFRIVGKDPWINCLILDEINFEKWRAENEFSALNSTGSVPAGRVSRSLPPGNYFLVFDNRSSEYKNALVDVSFSAE